MPTVSVVVITKNQEWNVPRLIESVLHATAAHSLADMVLVDSASTDRTVEIARQYPISIISLHADQRLTAGMGRLTGYKHTTGDYILFLDGDMELGQGWLDRALMAMEANPDLAVITGQVIDRPPETPYDGKFVTSPNTVNDLPLVPMPYTGGAALYRRSVLESVGNFHPYAYSDEEPDLCIRIRHAGHRIARIDYPIAYHYSRPTEAISTLFARRKRNLYLGAGQNLRYNAGRNTFAPYLCQRGYGLVPAAGLAVGVYFLLRGLLTGRWRGFTVWMGAVGAVVAADAMRKRSLYRAVFSLILRLMIMEGTIRGLLLEPMDEETHPVRFELVQRAGERIA